MTKNEFENLKPGDVVYLLSDSYETDLPVVERYVAVGILEGGLEWVIRPFDRDKDYSWANRHSMFLTRKEAEKEAVETIKRRIEDNKQELNRYKGNIKKLESNLMKFYQNSIEIKPE